MRRSKRARRVLLAFLVAASNAVAIGIAAAATPAPSVAESPSAEAFPLVASAQAADVFVDANDAAVVSIAANLFASDVERVAGHKPAVRGADDLAGANLLAAVIVGTVGQSRLIDGLVAAGKLDVSSIKGQWEGTATAIVADPAPGVRRALVIAGSDRRGAAYGLMSLSRSIGVSPWEWWADVPPAKHPALYVSVPAASQDAPAVRYRGIFINDEDWGLNPWASQTYEPDFKNIGPKTYERVFELMLRLRLNYLWPAMHAVTKEFAATPENVALADRYAIVAGSSHCEPMLCNNVHWDERTRGRWNYSTNRDAIHAYWQDMAQSRGDKEAVWTLGIRGIHDAGMQRPPEDMPGKLELMSKIFADQRALLDQFASKQWGPVAQCFVPYKEVLPIYDAGLKVPDDVTLVWVDDNFGYIRRLGAAAERKRAGGAGVYWHLSYYGNPHSYTWVNTTSPALIWEELHKAWENDARRLWVINVGDVKPMEIGIDYFSKLAWDPEAQGPDTQPRFLQEFAAATFGDGSAPPIADLLGEYYRLGTIRKPELMNRAWATSLPADVADRLAQDYAALLERERAVAAAIPTDRHDAYTELVGFPARVLAETGQLFLADRRARLGGDAAASEAEIARLRADLEAQVKHFNEELAGGKWNRMMPGLVTGKDLTAWNSQVRWPWGEKTAATGATTRPQPQATRAWRDAATADRQSAAGEARWVSVPGLGTSARAMALKPAGLSSTWQPGDAAAPGLEFDFDFRGAGGDAEAWLDFLPAFRIAPGMRLRVAVSVDGQPPEALEVPGSSGAEDEVGSVRALAIQNNYARLRVPLPGLTPGKHTLTIRAIDPGAVVDRVALP